MVFISGYSLRMFYDIGIIRFIYSLMSGWKKFMLIYNLHKIFF